MGRLGWYIGAIKRQLKKGKRKTLLKFLFKKSYRKDIIRIRKIHQAGEMSDPVRIKVRLSEIRGTHEINYPKVVEDLSYKMWRGEDKNIPPIEVIYLWGAYYVLDGNHRLEAYQMSYPSTYEIDVLVYAYVSNKSYAKLYREAFPPQRY